MLFNEHLVTVCLLVIVGSSQAQYYGRKNFLFVKCFSCDAHIFSNEKCSVEVLSPINLHFFLDGSRCTMRDGGAGTCKNIRECKSFLDGLRHRTVSPGDRVHCSFLVIFLYA